MVIINGQQFTNEEFEQLKEEQYKEFCDNVKCGYAIIPETNVAICGLDSTRIDPFVQCKNCVSYKEKVFEVIE